MENRTTRLDSASADELAAQLEAEGFGGVWQGRVTTQVLISASRHFDEAEKQLLIHAILRRYRRGAGRRRNQWRARKSSAKTDSPSMWDGE